MSWPFSVRPLTAHLGAEVSGVDLAQDIPEELFAALYQAFLRYQVLLFPPRELSPARQVEFGRRFGRAADPRDEPVSR
jgi:taurine dioxygenase